MFIEGKGYIVPKPENGFFSGSEMRLAEQCAELRDGFHDYASARTEWRRGLISRASEIGILGEIAFSKWLAKQGVSMNPDFTLRKNGDSGYDFRFGSLTIDIKTSTPQRRERPCLIRRISSQRRIIPLAEVYVFAECSVGDAAFNLCGYAAKNDLETLEKSPISSHFNIRLDKSRMRPMSRLACLIRAKLIERAEWLKLDIQAASIK